MIYESLLESEGGKKNEEKDLLQHVDFMLPLEIMQNICREMRPSRLTTKQEDGKVQTAVPGKVITSPDWHEECIRA